MSAQTISPNCQEFAKHVGSVFTVLVDDAEVCALELSAVKAYERGVDVSDASLRIASFSLFFHSHSAFHLPQSSYCMLHPVLDQLEVFIVPLGPDARGMQYEAVFNQK